MTQLTQLQVQQLIAERNKLSEENTQMRALLQLHNLSITEKTEDSLIKTAPTSMLSVDDKIALFRSLFRGREDIYALRWEGKNGKMGYSPACINH